jgi:hypothetical protein
MMRMFSVATAVVLVIAGGAVHGLWTDRWNWSDEPGASAAKLDRVALSLDDWRGEDLVNNYGKPAGVAGMLSRRYVNTRDGQPVTILLVCGRPGPVSIHTPDVCYVATGYEMLSPTRCNGPAEAPSAELCTAQFRKTQSTDQTYLRIFWSWNATGTWQAPEDPRRAFFGQQALYKLYVIREMGAADEPLDSDPCLDLMKQLLPELQRALFENS